jgi:hypothetical protein
MSGTRSVTDVTELDGIASTRRLTIDVRSADFTFRKDADRVEPDASRGACPVRRRLIGVILSRETTAGVVGQSCLPSE